MPFLQTRWGNERGREKAQPGRRTTAHAAAAAVDWDAVSLSGSPVHRGHVCQPETTFDNHPTIPHQMKAASPATAVNLLIAALFSAEGGCEYGSKQVEG